MWAKEYQYTVIAGESYNKYFKRTRKKFSAALIVLQNIEVGAG